MHDIEITDTLAPLWERLRASFARAAVITGGAAAIAAHMAMAAALRREIHGWIGWLEHLVRKLLFAEAGRLEPLGPRTSSSALHAAPPRAVASKGAAQPGRAAAPRANSQDPETWSVRFSLAPPRDPRAVPESRAPRIRALWGPSPPPAPPPPPTVRARGERHAPLQLARRFEALRRVLADPRPYARRLADLMHRLVRRFPEVTLRFAARCARVGHFDRNDARLGVDCTAAALGSPLAFDSS